MFVNILIALALATIAAGKDCSTVCNLNAGSPICAQKGKEFMKFPNKCYFDIKNCEDNQDWELADVRMCNQADIARSKRSLDCTRVCPELFEPFCGFDGQSYKVFDNKCLMEVDMCLYAKSYEPAHMVDCLRRTPVNEKICPKICNIDFNPICASNSGHNVLYGNKCFLDMENCGKSLKWLETSIEMCHQPISVHSLQKPTCNSLCTLENNPVCGWNGNRFEEFGNKCVFENFKCANKEVWALAPLMMCTKYSEVN